MKIFNKCLRKNINSNFIVNSFNSNNFTLNKLSLISKTFARNIGRPNFDAGEGNNEASNSGFQAPPKIKIEKISNDFETTAGQNFDADKSFSRNNDFKQNRRGNFDNDRKESDFGDKPSFNNRRESFGENRGFRNDRDFKNKRFDDNGSNNFRERRSFGNNFESKNNKKFF